MNAVINIESGRWSFGTEVSGWQGMGFELNGETSGAMKCNVARGNDGSQIMTLTGKAGTQIIRFEPRADDALVITRVLRNTGTEALRVESASDGIVDDFGKIILETIHEYTLRYMHSSNVRTEKYPDSRPEYPLIRPVPYRPKRFNIGEGNHIPAFVICDEDYKALLVEGDLDQTRFERSWELGLDGNGDKKNKLIRTCRGIQTYPLAEAFELAVGEEITLSRVFYQILENTHPQDAYAGYVEELNRLYSFQGQHSPMLHGAVFCTWNYGTLRNIDEQLIVNRARALAERVPECTHFLIDDGYQKNRGTRNGPLDCFYPDLDCDRDRFPRGMKYVADEIRATGLTPCIWLSPAVYLDSQLAQEHPEWLLKDASGNPALLGKSTFLDVSVPEAREFLLKVFDLLFVQWGYKGVKFDFMTHWFTLASACFANGGSGPEWRDFVFGEIRKRIGNDGLFMTCIAMSMGNPFPGLNADCYRCGCDIHDGTWAEQLRACKATLPQILLEGRKTFLLNMDSAGFGDVPENEQLFRLTWIFITQGIIELGGAVENMPDKQIALWCKLLARIDRGHRVQCLDRRAFTGDAFPETLLVEYPLDSLTRRDGVKAHLACFNWDSKPRDVRSEIFNAGFGDTTLTDMWSGEKADLDRPLAGHSALLLEVR
ncbi:MAG: alpha-galactosidase [Victivallales bacterium]|nr:alpha-galactosidase [Victivallales bacterium]